MLTFCILYVLLQVGLSLRGLANPGRVRFAWGMYAVLNTLPTIDIVYPASVEQDVASRFLAVESRPEVDYQALLPPYICSTVPAAKAVHVESQTYTCRR